MGSDNYEAGCSCADLVKQAVPNGGSVIICLGSLNKDSAQRRRQGVIDSLLNRSIDPTRPTDPADAFLKGDKYPVTATLLDGFNSDTAAKMATDALKKYPDVKCFVGLLAYSAPALIRAIQPANKKGQIQIVGFDCDPTTLRGIQDGILFGTIRQHQYDCGYESVRILSETLKGSRENALPTYPAINLPVDVVTKQTLYTEAAENKEKLAR